MNEVYEAFLSTCCLCSCIFLLFVGLVFCLSPSYHTLFFFTRSLSPFMSYSNLPSSRPFHWLSLPCLSPLPFYFLPSLRHCLPASISSLCLLSPLSPSLSLCVPCPCNPRPQLLSLCVFVPLSPVLPPMVGCVSCVWMRPRKRSARP